MLYILYNNYNYYNYQDLLIYIHVYLKVYSWHLKSSINLQHILFI